MKPKTANQKEVMALTAKLRPMTEKQKAEARMAYGKIFIGRTSAWCSTCAKEWECDLYESNVKQMRCPFCGAYHDAVRSSKKRVFKETYYFAIIRVVRDWQVVRTYLCEKTSYKGEQAYFLANEAFQVWMKPEEKRVIVGRKTRPFSQYWLDRWDWSSPMELRKDHDRFDLEGWFGTGTQLLPIIKRAGLKRLRKDTSYLGQLEKAMNDYRAEVLLKNGQVDMFKLVARGTLCLADMWQSIRICIRHKYIIKDAVMWRDMFRMLSECGYDVRNPKYICPANLIEMHDWALARLQAKRARDEARREAQRRAEAIKDCNDEKMIAEYQQRVGRWLGIVVKSGYIELKPLQDIWDFKHEGDALNHCVFTNGYYKDEDCLIIGARVKGERTETIELNTKTWNIIQCRGNRNQDSEYHNQIYQLMEDNINQFRRKAI